MDMNTVSLTNAQIQAQVSLGSTCSTFYKFLYLTSPVLGMDAVSPNSVLAHYLDVLKEANYMPTFDRVIEMILRHCDIATTVHNTNIIHTTKDGMDYYSLSPELVLTLCNAMEIFFCILMHAVHNVPYHSVAMPLTIPPLQAHELGLDNLDNIEIGYYHLHAYHLEHAWYNEEA